MMLAVFSHSLLHHLETGSLPEWKTQFSARWIGQQAPGICLCLPAHPQLGSEARIDFAGGCCAFKSRSPCTRGECFPP